MRTISLSAALALLMCLPVKAADSTSFNTNPTMTLKTVSNGAACTSKSEIAQTVTGNYASCVNGYWEAQDITNPKYVIGAGKSLTGFDAVGAYVGCPANSKPYVAGCLVWITNQGTFWYDEASFAGGISGDFPIAGDNGVYCMYAAQTGASGTVLPIALCGDK